MALVSDDLNPIQIKLLTIGDSGHDKLTYSLLQRNCSLNLNFSGVGKSWLLLRWAGENGKFSKSAQSMPTIGIDFKMKNINVNGKRVKVQIVSYP